VSKQKEKLSEFTDEEVDWLARALAVMDPKVAVGAFLTTFPHFYEQGFGAGEVKERIYTRFKQAKYDKTRPLYSMIQENIAELNEVLKKYIVLYPVADPIERLNVLEQMRQSPEAIDTKLLRVMEIGAKIYEKQSKLEAKAYRESDDGGGGYPFKVHSKEDDNEDDF
jgi:hypothetical protein